MFWFIFSGVFLFCVSHGQLEYYDGDSSSGYKLKRSSDMDYISGVFGERQDPDGKSFLKKLYSCSVCLC